MTDLKEAKLVPVDWLEGVRSRMLEVSHAATAVALDIEKILSQREATVLDHPSSEEGF